jgi:hypothetical protein
VSRLPHRFRASSLPLHMHRSLSQSGRSGAVVFQQLLLQFVPAVPPYRNRLSQIRLATAQRSRRRSQLLAERLLVEGRIERMTSETLQAMRQAARDQLRSDRSSRRCSLTLLSTQRIRRPDSPPAQPGAVRDPLHRRRRSACRAHRTVQDTARARRHGGCRARAPA